MREILAIEVTMAAGGAPCTRVCALPEFICPREYRGAFLKKVATGLVLAAALTLAGPTLAPANVEPAGETRIPLSLDEGAAAADQHPQPHDESAAEAQDLQPPDVASPAEADDAPEESANHATAPWPPWRAWR